MHSFLFFALLFLTDKSEKKQTYISDCQSYALSFQTKKRKQRLIIRRKTEENREMHANYEQKKSKGAHIDSLCSCMQIGEKKV